MAQQVLVIDPPANNLEHEAVAHLHQGFNGAGHLATAIEKARPASKLAWPHSAAHHGAARLPPGGPHDVEAAAESPEGALSRSPVRAPSSLRWSGAAK